MTQRERRRNQYPSPCRACDCEVPANAGYLYRDTNGRHARQHHNRTGKFGWFVKCAACHEGGETKSTLATKAAGPAPKRWSVRDVAKWTLVWGQEVKGFVFSSTPTMSSVGIQSIGGEIEGRYFLTRITLPVTGEGWADADDALSLVGPDGQRESISYRHPIDGRLCWVKFWGGDVFFGQPLTDKAAELLSERIEKAMEEVGA